MRPRPTAVGARTYHVDGSAGRLFRFAVDDRDVLQVDAKGVTHRDRVRHHLAARDIYRRGGLGHRDGAAEARAARLGSDDPERRLEPPAGLGAVLLPKFLIEKELERGELVEILDLPLRREQGYYLVVPHENAEFAPVVAFRDWLLKTVG